MNHGKAVSIAVLTAMALFLASCDERKVLQYESSTLQRGAVDSMRIHSDPSMKELIKSEMFSRFWQILQSKYDMIVSDVPGLLDEDYGVNIAQASEAQLVIFNSTDTPINYIKEALEEMKVRGLVPDGLVMNQINEAYIESIKDLNMMKKKPHRQWMQIRSSSL